MDEMTIRFKITVADTSYGGVVTEEVIKKEVEVPFVPMDNMVYIDGVRKYRIRKPEFYPDEWVEGPDPQLRKRIFGCWLNNISSSDKQSYINDGWVEE